MAKKHLFVGYGDIASRCAKVLIEAGDEVVGIARSNKVSADGIEFWCGDAKSEPILAKVSAQYFDTVSIILSPDAYTEAAYRESYFESVRSLISCWKASVASVPGRIIFISSSSVYAQNTGELVNENSPAEPLSPMAKVLCETENLLLNSFSQAVVVRFSGIYGPGRDFLLRQVRAGKAGNSQYTNRIHIEDCCGVLLHVLALEQDQLRPRYLATDSTPVRSNEIRRWLAEKMNVTVALEKTEEASSRGGDKQCDNSLLRKSGYVFKYPSYKDGYLPMVDAMAKY